MGKDNINGTQRELDLDILSHDIPLTEIYSNYLYNYKIITEKLRRQVD